LLCQQQRYEEADQEIRKLQKQGGLGRDLQRLAAAVSLQSRDSSRAVGLAMQAVREDSTDYRDHLWLGQVLASAEPVEGERGISSYRSNQEQAEKHFRRAVELAPQIPETWLLLVRHLASLQKRSEAEQVINQVRQHLPKESGTMTLAACYETIGQFDQARDQYLQALGTQPRNPDVMRRLASFYLRTGHAGEAEPILKQLMNEKGSKSQISSAKKPMREHGNPDARWARRQLAFVLIDRGESRQALAMVDLGFDKTGSLVEVSPPTGDATDEDLRARARVLVAFGSRSTRDRAIVYLDDLNKRHVASSDDQLLLARLYEMNGSWEKARASIRTLATSSNRNPLAVSYYIHCLLHDHELDDAERFLDQLDHQEQAQKRTGLPPRTGSGAFTSVELRAQLLEARGEGRKALTLLEGQAREANADPEIIIAWISALARQQRWADALELADRASDRLPAETVGGMSVALLRSFRSNEEIRSRIDRRLRAAIQANPKSANLALQLADLLQIADRFEEAEALYRQVLTEQGRNFVALNNLSWLLALKPGKTKEALELINLAIDVAGPQPQLLDTRAVVYLAMDRSEPAITDLEQALADSPSAFRYFHLARAHRLAQRPEAAAQAFRKATEAGLELELLHPTERVAFREMSRDYEVK
jgi:tetratricopeptide (TPR) repeat protein